MKFFKKKQEPTIKELTFEQLNLYKEAIDNEYKARINAKQKELEKTAEINQIFIDKRRKSILDQCELIDDEEPEQNQEEIQQERIEDLNEARTEYMREIVQELQEKEIETPKQFKMWKIHKLKKVLPWQKEIIENIERRIFY